MGTNYGLLILDMPILRRMRRIVLLRDLLAMRSITDGTLGISEAKAISEAKLYKK